MPCHLGERLLVKPAVAERIGPVGVEAGRDQHQLRGVFEQYGDDDVLDQRHPHLLVGPGGDRRVDRVAEPVAGAGVAESAGAREQAALVDAGEQHVSTPAEHVGGAVAVMDVPVDDHHPLAVELPDRQLGGDGDVVEQAEAHRPVGERMMARRAHGAEPPVVLAGEQRAGHRAGAAHRVQGRVIGRFTDERVGIDLAAALQA